MSSVPSHDTAATLMRSPGAARVLSPAVAPAGSARAAGA
jgi:hypothetical protein